MRITMILNQDGGTIRGMDAREFADMAARKLGRGESDCTVRLVTGNELVEAFAEAAGDPQTEVIVAGGGDGTISAAAGCCFKSGKTLGVLPLGTMNLFARGIGMPLDPEEALDALAGASERRLDIATANGRPYVHQFSAGMHARLVRTRDRLDTSSRFRKISSTMMALGRVIRHPPRLEVVIDTGNGPMPQTLSAVAVSNNLFGDTPLAYAPVLDEGVLGLYRSHALDAGTALRMTVNAALGRLAEDPDMSVEPATSVTLHFPTAGPGSKAAIDGEIVPLERKVVCEIHSGALRALVPHADAAKADPAQPSAGPITRKAS